MRNKKIYNNLFDSICMTILFFVCLVFYLVVLWFGVINSNEGTDPIASLIISSVFFGVMITICFVLRGTGRLNAEIFPSFVPKNI